MTAAAPVLACAFCFGFLSGWWLGWLMRGTLRAAVIDRELDRLRSDNAALRSLAFEDWSMLHPDVPADEAAARFDLAVAVRAAGLARGDGDLS